MKPTPLTPAMRELIYTPEVFVRADEEDDRRFYATARLTSHLDDQALDTVRRLIGSLVVEAEPDILDLMASWDSHLPAGMTTGRVVGLGLNEEELKRNERLDSYVLHDLNREPRLPFPDGSFDVVLNTVSVDYLTHPFEVFEDVVRVLRPGGLHLVVFSSRFFPPKVVRIWKEASSQERVMILEDYFQASDEYTESRCWSDVGRPRPADDRYADRGVPSDPVFAVWAERCGGPVDRPERRPPDLSTPAPDPDELARRKQKIGETRCCPYCSQRLKIFRVPATPFVEFATDLLWVCFNDACPHVQDGFAVMRDQGNTGYSYRLMYDPTRGTCGSLPVPSLRAMRECIEDD